MDDEILKEIVIDYKNKFCNRKCVIETNYAYLKEFIVSFDISNLHHLLGLHKVTAYSSTETIQNIENGELTLSVVRSHRRANEVLPRIENYSFLEEIFVHGYCQFCVLEKDLEKNTMNLAVVFYKKDKKQYVIVGLKKDKRTNEFVPATLHVDRKGKYNSYRKTTFKIKEWI